MNANKIEKLKLKNRIFLAPMLEPNDIAFRILCKKANCGLTFTGMISPKSKQKLYLNDKPAIQIFSNNVSGIKLFMKKYNSKVSMWDFNLGCPSKLSKRLGHGAFMHDNLETIREIFLLMRSTTKKPCSIKLRKSTKSIAIAKIAQECGFDFISIHPRTIKQGYSGEPDYKFALKLKKSVNIKVIYSGNVNMNNYKKILEDFDYIMIGRAAIGRPNIFSEMTNKKSKITFLDYLKLAEKYKLYFRQIKFQAMNFTHGEKNAKKLRRKIVSCKNINEIRDVFKV